MQLNVIIPEILSILLFILGIWVLIKADRDFGKNYPNE